MTTAERYVKKFGDWKWAEWNKHTSAEVENLISELDGVCISERKLRYGKSDNPLEYTFEDGSVFTLMNPDQTDFAAYGEAE